MRALSLALLILLACDQNKPTPEPPPPPTPPVASSVAIAATTAAPTPTPTPTPSEVASTPTPNGSGSPPRKQDTIKAALKPAAKHQAGKNFALDLATAGCKAGEECAMTIKMNVEGDFHINKEYPYKFIGAPAPSITFLGKADPNQFTKAAGDFVASGEKSGVMTVRFKAPAAGDTKIAGKYKLSVCNADQCQIEEEQIELPVTVL